MNVFVDVNEDQNTYLYIPIKFPFKNKKDLLKVAGGFRLEPEKLVKVLDKYINSSPENFYEVYIVLVVNHYWEFPNKYKKLSLKSILKVLEKPDGMFNIQEPRLHYGRLKHYYSYYIPFSGYFEKGQVVKGSDLINYCNYFQRKRYNSFQMYKYVFCYVMNNLKALYMKEK